MKTTDNTLKIVNTNFKAEDASNMLLKNIKFKINNYKLKRLSCLESDECSDVSEYDKKISDLNKEINSIKELLAVSKEKKCDLILTETLELNIAS